MSLLPERTRGYRRSALLELPRRSDFRPWPKHGEYWTQLILGNAHSAIHHLRGEGFGAEVVDQFDGGEDGWVLSAALGPGLDFKRLDGEAHLAAENKLERIGGAGREAGQQHFKRGWIGVVGCGVVHFDEMIADLHVDAHVSTMNGANG